jgi:hypothetical protein
MQTVDSHWEDEDNNRRVAYSAAFTRQAGSVEIMALTPKQVTFLCPQSKTEVRSIGVWTEKGRELLAHQLRTSGHLTELERQIETGLAV